MAPDQASNPIMPISIHDIEGVTAFASECRIEPEPLRRFRNAFYKRHLSLAQAADCIPPDARDQFLGQLGIHCLDLQANVPSCEDDAHRLCFRTVDGHPIETVLMTASSGRTSICISCQAGCPLDCVFCATGSMPFARGLTREEILDQVVQGHDICRSMGKDLRNIVFMGMGEPLLHREPVFAAIDVLLDSRCFNASPRRTIVSTCGIPDGMRELVNRFPGLGLAVSLHSAVSDVRQILMPTAASRFPLSELRRALEDVSRVVAQEIMIEYMLLDGVNDSVDAAIALVEFLSELNVFVNLITYNPTDCTSHSGRLVASKKDRFSYFSAFLQDKGFKVTKRYSHGRDINAACGQLAGKLA